MQQPNGPIYYVIIEWGGEDNKPPSKWYRWQELMIGISAGHRSNGKNTVMVQEGAITTIDREAAFLMREMLLNGLDINQDPLGANKAIKAQEKAKELPPRTPIAEIKGSGLNDGHIIKLADNGILTAGDLVATATDLLARLGGGIYIHRPMDVRIIEGAELAVDKQSSYAVTVKQLQKKFGQRGKKMFSTWTVTCHGEGMSYEVSDTRPITCPSCGSPNVATRPGAPMSFFDPGGDFFEAWKRTRFAQGHWEFAETANPQPAPDLHAIGILDDHERDTYVRLSKSKLLDLLTSPIFDRDAQFEILDVLLLGLSHWPPSMRASDRRDAFLSVAEAGCDARLFPLVEGSEIDLLSLAGPLPADRVAQYCRLAQDEAERLADMLKADDKLPDETPTILLNMAKKLA